MPIQDIDGVIASLKDHSDCEEPVAAEAAKSDEAGKGKKKVEKTSSEEKIDHGTTGSIVVPDSVKLRQGL
jgi:hypothetical protein